MICRVVQRPPLHARSQPRWKATKGRAPLVRRPPGERSYISSTQGQPRLQAARMRWPPLPSVYGV
jgi:hypothetical protein